MNQLPSMMKLEPDFFNKLLNFFLIGDTYYFTLNHQTLATEFVSKEVEDILGYHPHEFNILFMNEKLHPDDRSWYLSFGKSIGDFLLKIACRKSYEI